VTNGHPSPQSEDTSFKSGYVCLTGPPNAGKSTLLNRVLGRTVSIVAPRPQTTRHRVLGILNGAGFQALFLDTPGVLEPRYRLQEMMKQEVDAALRDGDVVLLLYDATATGVSDRVLEAVRDRNPLVAVNKVDLVEKRKLLPLVEKLAPVARGPVFLVSALNGDGVPELQHAVVDALPEGEPFYPPEMVSERPERFFCAEFVREAVFNLYGEEIPYSTAVSIEEFKEREGRKDYIRAVIFVERQAQKKIVVGRQGQALKRVGSRARRRIEEFLGRPVYLELWVKVAEDWRRKDGFIRQNVYESR